MATNVKLLRYDWTSTGEITRDSITRDQADINAIYLNTDKLTVKVNRTVTPIEFPDRLPELFDLGMTNSNVVLMGTFTGDPSASVDAAWQMDDLWYASVNWFQGASSTAHVSTLSWTENKVYSATAWVSGADNADSSIVMTGLIKTVTFNRISGEENQIAWALIFELGT